MLRALGGRGGRVACLGVEGRLAWKLPRGIPGDPAGIQGARAGACGRQGAAGPAKKLLEAPEAEGAWEVS